MTLPATDRTTDIERRELAGPPELAERFEHVRWAPWGERALAFELIVPKEFAATADLERRASGGPLEFVKIGAFRAGASESIDVSLARPGRDVSLADAFEFVAERFGLETLALDPLDFGGREAVDALARWTAPEGRRLSRLVIFRDGEHLVRIGGTAAEERYPEQADAFAVAISTFKLLDPHPAAFLEPFEWALSSGAIPLGFRRPAAWRVEERRDVPWGRQVLDLRWLDRAEIAALMRAKVLDRDVVSDLTLDGLTNETLEELRPLGFQETPGKRRRVPPPEPGEPFLTGTTLTVHDGRAFGQPAEARILALKTARLLYALAAVFPAREVDRFAWMAGKRALEVALQTLNRPEEDVLAPRGSGARPQAGSLPQPDLPRAASPEGESEPYAYSEEE